MTPSTPTTVRRRRWVHVTAIVIIVAAVLAPGLVGVIGFSIANSDSGTRPAAPIAGFVFLAAAFLIAVTVGLALVSLLYLLAKPARSRVLLALHIVGTLIAIAIAVVTIIVVGPWFDQF